MRGNAHSFLQLPNVIGSPHNSASVADASDVGLRHALVNCRSALTGETPLHVVQAGRKNALIRAHRMAVDAEASSASPEAAFMRNEK